MVPARGVTRLLRAGLLVGLAAFACQAAAQDKPRPRPKPLPEPSDAHPASSNSLSDAPGSPLPGVLAPGVSPAAPGNATSRDTTARPPALRPLLAPPPPLVLRSAVHSRYSQPAVLARSTTGQCRAQCAEQRTQCASGESDASGCDPPWTRCLSACDGLTYSRGP